MMILGLTEEDRMTLCNCVETQLTTTVTPVTSGTAAAAPSRQKHRRTRKRTKDARLVDAVCLSKLQGPHFRNFLGKS